VKAVLLPILTNRARDWRTAQAAVLQAKARNQINASRYLPGRYEALERAAWVAWRAFTNACRALGCEPWDITRETPVPSFTNTHRAGCEKRAQCSCKARAKAGAS